MSEGWVLPPWQVEAAASPRGPGKEKNFPASKGREAVAIPVDVREGEVGRLEGQEPVGGVLGRLADGPDGVLGTRGYRLAHMTSESREVDPGRGPAQVKEP